MPGGGITPARSLRITFSHNSAWSPAVVRSNFSSVKLALFVRSLWQVTQYLSRTARYFEAPATSTVVAAVRCAVALALRVGVPLAAGAAPEGFRSGPDGRA